MRSRCLTGLSLGASAIFAISACSSSNNESPGGSTRSSASVASSIGSPTNSGSYQLDPSVMSLHIDASVATVDVTSKDGASAISVQEKLHGKAATTKDVAGSSATLTAKCPEGITFGDECSVTYTVTMPGRVSLYVDGSAGNVKLTGPFSDATISTNAGWIDATGLGAGKYQVTTNAGRTSLTFSEPPDSVKVKTDVGKVTLTVPGTTKYAVSTDTTVGLEDVHVDKDPSSPHRLDVTTTVGSITINKG